MVVNYPFDNYAQSSYSKYSKTNDDDVFRSIAKNYSYNHPTMRNNKCDNFKDGITNGGLNLMTHFSLIKV